MNLPQNPCVLPSNAPSHYDIISAYPEIGSPNRVLQERCRNRQDELVEHQYHQPVKLTSPENTENRYRPVVQLSYNGHRSSRSYYNDEARKKRDAERLWRSLLACPAYRKYRNRQPTKPPNDGEQKWPEHMERAFCEALVEHPPMGRRKQTMDHDPKPRGRNELIADYIHKLTGVERSRKQVSSHIQVMKPMVKDDPFILSYLSKPEQDGRRSRHRSHSSLVRKPHLVSAMHSRSFHHPQPSRLASQVHDSFLPRSVKYEHDFSRKGTGVGYRPMLFEMYVADTQREPSSIIHKFSGFGDSPQQPDCNLEDKPQLWRRTFPPLTELHAGGMLSCQVIFCDASIALLPQGIPANAELRIQLEIETQQDIAGLGQMHCRTSFYDGGSLLEKNDRPVSTDTRYSRCQISFGSQFWAAKTVSWQKALRCPDAEKRTQAEADVRDAVARLSAVQEISCYPPESEGPLTVLLICWRFKQVKDRGITTWRSVTIRDELTKAEAKNEMLMNRCMDQIATSYQQDILQATSTFDQNGFDIGDLTNVSIPDLTPELDPTVVGAEAFPANEIDFNGGSIQICMDSNLPVDAYATATNGFDNYSHHSSTDDWTARYHQSFDQDPYGHGAFEQLPIPHSKDDTMLGSQQFGLSPVTHMRSGTTAINS